MQKKQSKIQSKKEKKRREKSKKEFTWSSIIFKKEKSRTILKSHKRKKRIEHNIGLVPQKSQE